MQLPEKPLSTLITRLRLLRHKHTARHTPRHAHDQHNACKIWNRKPEESQEPGYVRLSKSRGQHLLVNQRILDSIVRKSNIMPTDTVLEIGPGTGNLTIKLLQAARRVVAVEVDERMVEAVSNRAAEHELRHKLTVIGEDALKAEFPQFDLVVANIPYNISSPLVGKIVFGGSSYRSATLLLQKEFARRLLANPGDSEYNRLAVNVKLVADVELVMGVSKREFVPCPRVDSSVVIIRPKAEIPNVDLAEWRAFTRTCFNKKNKTLGATLKQKKKVTELLQIFSGARVGEATDPSDSCCGLLDGFDDESDDDDSPNGRSAPESETGASFFKEKIVQVLTKVGYEDRRPSKISNQEFLHLLKQFNQAGIYFHPASSRQPRRVAS
uniref:rRNA adenine N(6)-methyltransferase n=1 Tax=Kalanchoe fedtschenkoi TaxID=63787 RepID=A0A7N0V4H0_KALFE